MALRTDRYEFAYLRRMFHLYRRVREASHSLWLVQGQDRQDGLDVSRFRCTSTISCEYSVCSGNVIVVASSTSLVIALTWGGVQYPWSSSHVLIPLTLGIMGLGFWFVYEAVWATHPIVCPTHRVGDYPVPNLTTVGPVSASVQ